MHTWFKNALFLSLLMVISIFGNAQKTCSYTVSGMVMDSLENEPIPFANIFVKQLNTGDVTDLNGAFAIKNLCEGEYLFVISHLGGAPLEEIVSITTTDKQVVFYLSHSSVELETVKVEGHKHDALSGEATQVLSKKDAFIHSGSTLTKKLEQLSGVSSIQTGSNISKPVIRGMHSNRLLILNNGVRQEGQNWGAEHAPEIDPFLAQEVTLVTGANSVKYGSDAIAGVLLVEPNKLPASLGTFGEVILSGNSNGKGGAVSGNISGNTQALGGFKYRLQGTLRKAGTLRAPDYYLSNTGVTESNFSVAAQKVWGITNTEVFYSQFNTEIGILAYAHVGNTSDLLRTLNNSEIPDTAEFTYNIRRPKQQVSHELIKVKESVYLNEQNTIYATYSRQYNERSEFDREKPLGQRQNQDDSPEFQYRLTTHITDAEWENRSLKKWVFKSGLNGTKQTNTYSGKMFIPNFENHALAGYFIVYRETNTLDFSGGIRYDKRWLTVYRNFSGNVQQNNYQFSSPSFSLNAEKKWGNWSIQATTGKTFRAPAPNELFSDGLHHGSSAIETGNEHLQPETAWNNQVAAAYKSESEHLKWNIGVTVFQNYIDNFINLIPTGEVSLTIRGAFPNYVYVAQNALFQGVELEGGVQYKQWNLTAVWNVVRAKDRKTDSFLPYIPSDNGYVDIAFSAKKTEKWSVETFARVNYTAKQIRGNSFQILEPTTQSLQSLSDFAPAPDAYALLNLGVMGHLTLKNHPIDWSLTVENVWNKKYRNYMNRQRFFADEIGRNIKINLKIPITIKNKKQS